MGEFENMWLIEPQASHKKIFIQCHPIPPVFRNCSL